ncbi:MAG: LPS export ABC transporter permease LptG [Deltaproteobacteria bacterium RBG_13_61_14]|nr:MAG: LPS export ABC transporter permease LptG [Deltaproteobacteria bacterium RBG_13_61_14]
MRVLDRYVLKSFLVFFLVALVIATLLFLVVSVLDSLGYLLIKQKAPLSLIVLYYLFQVPQTIYLIIPMAALFSALITLGLMAQRSELVAAFAAGISGFRIALPLLVAGFLLSVAMFFFGDLFVPLSNSQARQIERRIKGKRERKAVRESRIWYVSERKHQPPRFYRILRLDREKQMVEGFQLYEVSKGFRLLKSVEAARGRYTEAGWEFEDVTTREFPPEGPPTITSAAAQTLALKEKPQDLLVIQLLPEEMNSWQLSRQARNARHYGLDVTEYQVELASRPALPFSCLILMLLGIPRALQSSRTSSLARNLLLAALSGFGYYVVVAEALALGRGGIIPPALAAWAGNVIFFLVAVQLLRRTSAPTAPA